MHVPSVVHRPPALSLMHTVTVTSHYFRKSLRLRFVFVQAKVLPIGALPHLTMERELHQQGSSSSLNKAHLQLHLERALASPRSIAKILYLVKSRMTKDHEIEELNERNWTLLVGVIFRLGVGTTKNGNTSKSEEQLEHVIRVCHERGLSMNSFAIFASQYQRPIIVAAYYGYHSAVWLLVELGALPDLPDSEGRNVLYSALQNPVGSNYLRECDKLTAQVLVDLGIIISDLGSWNESPTGTLCYVNELSSRFGSLLYRAIKDKNVDAVKFLCRSGGVIIDDDYRHVQKYEMRSRFLSMVAVVCEDSYSQISAITESVTNGRAETELLRTECLNSWNQHID